MNAPTHRLGNPCMDWNEVAVARLRSMVADGWTDGRIAAEFGVKRNSIIGKRHRLGLTAAGRDPKHYIRPRTGPPKVRAGNAGIERRIRHNLTHKPPQPRSEPAEPLPETRCGILELDATRCRWPLWSDADPSGFYCGGLPIEGLPYCGAHCRMAYTPTSNRGAPTWTYRGATAS